MYYLIFVFTILAFVILRGIRLTKASGFRFYMQADFALAAALTAAMGVTMLPWLSDEAQGQRNDSLPWLILILGLLASGTISYRGQKRAIQERPERWRTWVRARSRMNLFDRLAGRYPNLDGK